MNKNFADDALRGLLGRRVPAWARYALVLLATAVFAVFAYHARYAKIDEFTGFRAEEFGLRPSCWPRSMRSRQRWRCTSAEG